MAAFRSEVAFVCNNINIRVADCLMVCLRGEVEDFVAERHGSTTKMLRLLTELCSAPESLRAWGYSIQLSTFLINRLKPVPVLSGTAH